MQAAFRFSALVFLLALTSLATSAQRVTHVVTHNRTTVETNPATGFKSYPAWGVFPARGKDIRRVLLKVTFACPDGKRCADWDYLDHIRIQRTHGVEGKALHYEIGRMLTPYGGAFAKDWKFTWEVDVTDFSEILRDSVEIEYWHSGYEPAGDRGWAVTLDFEITEGRPVALPLDFFRLYQDSYKYGDTARSIEADLTPVHIVSTMATDHARLRIFQTGHGMDEAENCGEFCSKYREIYLNGQLIDKHDIWKKCGDNPLYPQAGTWIYDRANWCPGYLQIPDSYMLPIKGQGQHVVDINMQPYSDPKAKANESITAFLFLYGQPTAAHDAMLEDIIVPSQKDLHLRKNPSATQPVILLRNNGREPLRSAVIRYGTRGKAQHTYNWKGNLAFGASAEVVLPGPIETVASNNVFEATISQPNGKKDGWVHDNQLVSPFTPAPVVPPVLVWSIRTNNEPKHNHYFLRDAKGQIIAKKQLDTSLKQTVVTDTFHLQPGAYELVMKDTAGDGLEFWFNTEGGRGTARLLNQQGAILKNFDSDFGNTIYYSFVVSNDSTRWAPVVKAPAIGLFPTRTTGKTSLDYFSNQPQDVTVKIITDEGAQTIETHEYKSIQQAVFTYDLSYRKPQRYYLKVFVGGQEVFNKRIRVIE
jgi:hypothetical protein